MEVLASINIAGLVLLGLLVIFLHGLSERDAERREIVIRHHLQDVTGFFGTKLDRVENYAKSDHQLLLELQILTPKGKKAARNFVSTAPTSFVPITTQPKPFN